MLTQKDTGETQKSRTLSRSSISFAPKAQNSLAYPIRIIESVFHVTAPTLNPWLLAPRNLPKGPEHIFRPSKPTRGLPSVELNKLQLL
jgi:hypothetical protein